jgi:hypothetical protein
MLCCCCVIVVPPSHHCTAPGAPTIHPTSSCSSAWGWVLHQTLSSSLSSSFPPPPPPPPPSCPPLSVVGHRCYSLSIPCHPTHDPPHGQWLIRVGVGGVSFVIVVVIVPPSFGVCRSLSPCPLFVICCHLSLSIIVCCLSLFIVCHCLLFPHYLLSPHCLLSHHCLLSIVVPIPLFIPCSPVIPPMSHPTSSGLWGWGWVVHCPSLSGSISDVTQVGVLACAYLVDIHLHRSSGAPPRHAHILFG